MLDTCILITASLFACCLMVVWFEKQRKKEEETQKKVEEIPTKKNQPAIQSPLATSQPLTNTTPHQFSSGVVGKSKNNVSHPNETSGVTVTDVVVATAVVSMLSSDDSDYSINDSGSSIDFSDSFDCDFDWD